MTEQTTEIAPEQETEPTEEITEEPAAETEELAEAGTQEPSAPSPYSQEELKALDWEKVDTTRIPPEMQPFYKGMVASFTKKTQELSNLRRQYEEGQKTQETRPPASAEEAYARDPQGVVNYIQGKIAETKQALNKLLAEDPYNAAELWKLNNQIQEYDKLQTRLERGHEKRTAEDNALRSWSLGEIKKTIPDIEQRAEKLDSFVLALNPDISKEEINFLTDAAIMARLGMPDLPRKLSIFVNTLYEAYQRANLQSKKVIAPKVEAPGGGGEPSKPNNKSLYDRATENPTTENWAKYLEATSKAK